MARIYKLSRLDIEECLGIQCEDLPEYDNLRLSQYRHVKKILEIFKFNRKMPVEDMKEILDNFVKVTKDRSSEQIVSIFKHNFLNCSLQYADGWRTHWMYLKNDIPEMILDLYVDRKYSIGLNNKIGTFDLAYWGRKSVLGYKGRPNTYKSYVEALRRYRKKYGIKSE